jgi:hypothetical protein
MDQIGVNPQVLDALPTRVYSLREFTARASHLYQEDPNNFLRFTLTGVIPGEHQAVIDPLRNFLDHRHEIIVNRDYDSIIGIAEQIEINCKLCLYPVSNPKDALQTSVHLNHAIEYGGVGTPVLLLAREY